MELGAIGNWRVHASGREERSATPRGNGRLEEPVKLAVVIRAREGGGSHSLARPEGTSHRGAPM